MSSKANQKKKHTYSQDKNNQPSVKVSEPSEIGKEDELPETKTIVPVKEFSKPIVNVQEAQAAFEQYQQLMNALIKEGDIVEIQGKQKIKKSGMNKISRFFGISVEIIRDKVEKVIGPQGGTIYIFKVHAKAILPNGQFRVSGGACATNERRFAHLWHDPWSVAETRAKKRAIEELAGMGEYELMEEENGSQSKVASGPEGMNKDYSELSPERKEKSVFNAQNKGMEVPEKKEGFFEPLASEKMKAMVQGAVDKLGWKLTVPLDKLTQKQAKAIADKAIPAAKRKGIWLTEELK